MKITQPKGIVSMAMNVGAGGVVISDPGGVIGGGPITLEEFIELYYGAGIGPFLTVIGGGKGTVQDHGTLGATKTLDLANGNYHHGELDDDCDISTTGWTNLKDCQITVELTGDGTSTPTFLGVTWIGSAPGIIGSGDVILVVLVSRDGGTTIYGAVVGGGSTIADILDLPTAEMDDTLVLAPDGAGGVEFRAETGGGGGGGLVLLEQHTASASATLDFTTFISGTYDEYQFEFIGLVPADNSVAFYMRMGTGGGPTYDSSGIYGWGSFVWRPGATAFTGVEGTATQLELSYTAHIDNTSTRGVNGHIRLFDPQTTARWKYVNGEISYIAGGFRHGNMCQGDYDSTTAVTAIRFLFSSGNIASGTVRVYGIAKV